MRPDRHDFVLLAGSPEPDICGGGLEEVEAWRAAGLPFVVASARAGDPPDTVRLGLATPDKRRIGFRVRRDRIGAVLPPPKLEEARSWAPSGWLPTIGSVEGICAATGQHVHVFGSLAWSYRSSRPYLREGSDLDLLVVPRPGVGLARTREAVARLLGACVDGPRLDGELRLDDGAAVNLREFADAPAEILVKAHGGAALVLWDDVAARVGARP